MRKRYTIHTQAPGNFQHTQVYDAQGQLASHTFRTAASKPTATTRGGWAKSPCPTAAPSATATTAG